jgi:hypothetical protein
MPSPLASLDSEAMTSAAASWYHLPVSCSKLTLLSHESVLSLLGPHGNPRCSRELSIPMCASEHKNDSMPRGGSSRSVPGCGRQPEPRIIPFSDEPWDRQEV